MYSKQIQISLKNVIVFCQNVEKTSGFYSEALGLKVINQSKQLVELKDKQNSRILLKQMDKMSQNLKGYSPVLNFEVDEFDKTIDKLKQYGVEFDGDIINNEELSVCFFKSPNGEFITLFNQKQQYDSDEEVDEDDGEDSKTNQEIKRILQKIKF